MFKTGLMTATSLAYLMLGQVAAAQSDEASQTVELASVEDAEARQATVVVTGQKIERSLQDTQTSVEVITALDLQEENIIDLVDAIERTANVTTRDGGRFTIRGIDSLNVSGAGQGDLATIYVDGVALPREASFAAPADIWDVSQIEVFRGPQSTLQGRASLAGAIIINTEDPTYEWSGRARAVYTTEEEAYRLGGAIGGPIIEDQVAFRLSAERSESDDFGTNVTRDEPLDPVDTLNVRGKLLIEPSAIPDLEILLSYSHDERKSGEVFSSLAVDDPEDNRVGFGDFPIRYTTEIDIATATLNYQISDDWSLTSITGWNDVFYGYVFDEDRSAEPLSILTFDNRVETLSQELRAQYDGDRIKGVFGAFASQVDTPLSFNDGQRSLDLEEDLGLSLTLQSLFGLDAPTAAFVVAQYPDPAFINTTTNLTQDVETWAVFSDVSWDFTDAWTLYAGFRYDVETQSNTNESLVTVASELPDPSLYSDPLNLIIAGVNDLLVADAADASSPAEEFASDDFGGFLPKLGLGYAFDDAKSLSFTIQRGYRSGGAAINAARSEAYEFDQEFIWNYELAWRSQWLNGALTLNANAFYIDWTDQQVTVQLSNNVFDTETQNAGSSNVRGFEIETYYDLTDSVDLYGSLGYAKTEFEEFIVLIDGEPVDFAGNEFAFAPQWTLNGGVTWRPGQNWITNVNANYASSSYIRADREQTSRDADARTLVNFRAGWENDSFGIYLTGANLLDEEYVLTEFPNDPLAGDPAAFAQFGAPRTFSIQLETRF